MLRRPPFAVVGIVLAVAYWVLEAALHAFVFERGPFVDRLFSHDVNEMWMRLLISIGFIAFGFYAQHAVERERRLHEELQELAQRQRRIIDSAYDAYVSIDQDGRVNGWNLRAEQMFGWTAPEVKGKRLEEVLVPPALRDTYLRGMERYLTEGVGNWLYKPMHAKVLHRDGLEMAVEIVVVPLRSHDDQQEFFAFIRKR